MDDEPKVVVAEEEATGFGSKHRFILLLVITIVISLILTSVALAMYNISGTAQLDLSRPGYQSVSDQVETDKDSSEYSAFGPVNKDTVDEFKKLYDKQAAKAKAVDAFNGDPLNPEVLMFGTSNATE